MQFCQCVLFPGSLSLFSLTVLCCVAPFYIGTSVCDFTHFARCKSTSGSDQKAHTQVSENGNL